MATPELIRRVTAERQAIKQQSEQQSETDRMFREMSIDCENLLNARGIVKRRPLVNIITFFTPFAKGRVLESSIPDAKGEPIKLTIFSTKINPAKYSEIIVGIGDFPDIQPFLSLERGYGNIKVLEPSGGKCDEYSIRRIRRANLQDAREWKEVVDALKEQNKTGQSSPIEHK